MTKATDRSARDRHKRDPISIRFPPDDTAWLRQQAQHTGEAVQRIIIRAVQQLRAREDQQ